MVTHDLALVDARSDSLTVTWPANPRASRYVLEFRNAETHDFQELSSKLTHAQARKRNLTPDQAYFFRVAPVVGETPGEWTSHDEPFRTLSTEEEKLSMSAPHTASGGNQALLVSWSKVDGAAGYELQMRENEGGVGWMTIAPNFAGTEVKKKNLTSKVGYQFRVRPTGQDGNSPFSPPSEPAVAKGLSEAMNRWFNTLDDGTLLRSGSSTPVPLADALGGKEFVLLYASAHWCPPCRKFTPMLANWYRTVKENVEVIFLSADHDEKGFKSYFATHPWMAVSYDDSARESLMAAIKVSGIPRLVVLDANTGKIVEDNAVGQSLDLNRWRSMKKPLHMTEDADNNQVLELADDEAPPTTVASSSEEKVVAPFLSQGEISKDAMELDWKDPKQARVVFYIILSLLPVLFLIPLMLGSRDLIPQDMLPPVEM